MTLMVPPSCAGEKPALGMILKGYPRISETFISNEILRLEELGFRIHLFSMRQPREPFSHPSVKKINAPVDYLPETLLASLPRLLRPNAALAARSPETYAKALSLAARRFARTRKSATIKHLLQAGYLVDNLLPGSGVQHLHAHFAHSPTSVALFASILSGQPFSFTAHAKDIYTSNPGQLREKIALATFVVTCTEYNRSFLQKIAGDSTTPIHRVYHGIDLGLFAAPAAGKRAKNSPFQILTIARLTPKKGLKTVYHALKLMQRQGVSFRHTLIGDGDDREETLKLIRDLGLESVTRWCGTLPHDQVIDHFRESDLFMLGCEVAANGDRDGIPNVLVESMAMGVPVLATRTSAIPELVTSGQTGVLVAPNDPSALADAASTLLADPALRQRLVAAGKKKVTKEFYNKTLIRDLAGIYTRMIPGIRQTN